MTHDTRFAGLDSNTFSYYSSSYITKMEGLVHLQLILAVHRATHRIGLYLEGALPDLGVSQGEAHLLAHLVEAGPSSVAALHQAFAHKRSTLTSYLDRLEQRDFVLRELHPDDRRSFLVSLTPKGKKVAAEVHAAFERLEHGALESVAARDVKAFHAVLAGLQSQAEAPLPKGGRR
jgi:DNA-binding MarR family transcriptional regulator